MEKARFICFFFRYDKRPAADVVKATQTTSVPEPLPPIFGFKTVENLIGLSEVELQLILSKNVDAALAVDMHASRYHMIEFIAARGFVKDTVISNTGNDHQNPTKLQSAPNGIRCEPVVTLRSTLLRPNRRIFGLGDISQPTTHPERHLHGPADLPSGNRHG